MSGEISERYSRQVILPEISQAGQQRLAMSSVLVIGAGGLGSPLLFELGGAGIGRIGLCDHDTVSISNLNRQFLYQTADIGKSKLTVAVERLSAFNPDVIWQSLPGKLDLETARAWIPQYDLVVTAVDSRSTRHVINQVCCETGKRMVDGGIRGFSGYLISVDPGKTPCYSCVWGPPVPDGNPAGDTQATVTGAIGATAGVIGSLEASTAIRLLLGLPDPLDGKMLFYDGSSCRFDLIEIQRAPHCPHCSVIESR